MLEKGMKLYKFSKSQSIIVALIVSKYKVCVKECVCIVLPMFISSSVRESPMTSNWNMLRVWENFCTAKE